MRPLRWYFALAFVISWTAIGLVAAGGRTELLFPAMLLGPSLSSIALTAFFDGRTGLRQLARRLLHVRVGARWYASLLLAPATLALVLVALSLSSSRFLPALASGAEPQRVILLALVVGVGAGVFEELGWTGFATPRLLRRYSWFETGVIIGLLWALWHMLADYLGRDVHGGLWLLHALEWFVALTAFRIFMTWVYSRTESLVLGMLLHVSFTGAQSLLWPASPSLMVEVMWYGVFAFALWIAVAFIARQRFTSVRATKDEKHRAMPGDSLVRSPKQVITHAITIGAPPERVWPWLAQLGAGRGGWYSWDRIDNAGEASADRVLDEHQHVKPGDVMPALRGASDAFIVGSVEPPCDLVLIVPGEDGPTVTWEHLVVPLDAQRSRMIVRGRVAAGWRRMARGAPVRPKAMFIERIYGLLGRLPEALTMSFGRFGHRFMEARHMRGIKRRAEALSLVTTRTLDA